MNDWSVAFLQALRDSRHREIVPAVEKEHLKGVHERVLVKQTETKAQQRAELRRKLGLKPEKVS